MLKTQSPLFIAIIVGLAVAIILGGAYFINTMLPTYFGIPKGNETVEDRLSEFEGRVTESLKPLFDDKKASYPPKHITLLLIKDQKKIYLFAGNNQFNVKYIKDYNVESNTSEMGPKLHSNDGVLPEGIYKISHLFPLHRYFIGLRLNYPNPFDIDKAANDNRKNIEDDVILSSDGGPLSVSRKDLEELFVLAAKSNYLNWKVVIAPTDMKARVREARGNEPSWISELDQQLLHAFLILP